ncbi:MAG: hypothetical protein GF330_14585 [Candidatus Eisenbacteria bacterium]|nr:hypothetical protein [Candidatus Eisenbacteria bacterium]
MAKPEITVKLDADGEVREGEVHPEVGAQVEVRFEDSTRCQIGIDYKDPDSLTLSLAGSFRLHKIGARNIRVSGELERSFFDRATEYRGSVQWRIPSAAAVEISADHRVDEDRIRAQVTLHF